MIAALSIATLALFLFVCLMAIFKPHWALVLIFSYFAFDQLLASLFSLFAQKSWLVNLAAGVASLCSLTLLMVRGQKPLRGYFNLNTVLILSLYLLACFGILYSRMPEAGVYFVETGAPYYFLMLFILPCLIASPEYVSRMTVPFLVVSCTIIVLILVSPRTQFFGTRMFIDLSYTKAGGNDRGNPLATAELGGLMVIIASLMETQKKRLWINLLRVAAISLGLSIAFLVGTRGQLVFSIAVSMLFYPLAHPVADIKQFFIRTGSAGSALLVLALVAKIFLFKSAATERFSSSEVSDGFGSRMFYWTQMLREWSANPSSYLQGLGTGSFNAIVDHGQEGYIYPHNLIIEVLTHHGLVGISLLLCIFLLTGSHMLGLVRMGLSEQVDRGVIAIVLALATFVTMISMKQGSFMLYPLPFYMYLVVSKVYLRTKQGLDIGTEYAEHAEYDEYSDYGEYGDDEPEPGLS